MFSTHGGQAVPICTRGNFSRLHRFALRLSKNNIWIGLTDLVWRDPSGAARLVRKLAKMSSPPTRSLNQFAHPGDAGNERFVPFLKINTRTTFTFCYWRAAVHGIHTAIFHLPLLIYTCASNERLFRFSSTFLVGGKHRKAALDEGRRLVGFARWFRYDQIRIESARFYRVFAELKPVVAARHLAGRNMP